MTDTPTPQMTPEQRAHFCRLLNNAGLGECANQLEADGVTIATITAERDAAQAEIARLTAALATPYQIVALAAERAATVTVKPLVWVQSHLTSWNDDWHTIPTAYTIRCCDENGWKWQGNGGHGYESSAKHAMTAVQGIHEAAIRSAITITSGTDSAKMHKAVEALRFYANGENWMINGPLDGNSGNYTGGPAKTALAEIGGA